MRLHEGSIVISTDNEENETHLCSPNSFTSCDMILSSHAPPSSCIIIGVVRSSNRWPEGVSSSTYKQEDLVIVLIVVVLVTETSSQHAV